MLHAANDIAAADIEIISGYICSQVLLNYKTVFVDAFENKQLQSSYSFYSPTSNNILMYYRLY